MTDLFIVRLREQQIPYGPFGSEREAKEFAAFLTVEVDPAEVERLRSPVGELLAWRVTVLPDVLRDGRPSTCRECPHPKT